MKRITRRQAIAMLAAGGTLTACGAPPMEVSRDNAGALATALVALGPGVDPAEAERAAQIAFAETERLAQAYQIVDPPLVHNTKVNLGIKQRGLCWHWAEDMEARLVAEGFETLEPQRAIANADNPFRLEHSTALLTRRGDAMVKGIVLDPWRFGGRLFWGEVAQDTRYNWRPRFEVLREKGLLRTRGEEAVTE